MFSSDGLNQASFCVYRGNENDMSLQVLTEAYLTEYVVQQRIVCVVVHFERDKESSGNECVDGLFGREPTKPRRLSHRSYTTVAGIQQYLNKHGASGSRADCIGPEELSRKSK